MKTSKHNFCSTLDRREHSKKSREVNIKTHNYRWYGNLYFELGKQTNNLSVTSCKATHIILTHKHLSIRKKENTVGAEPSGPITAPFCADEQELQGTVHRPKCLCFAKWLPEYFRHPLCLYEQYLSNTLISLINRRA